MEKVQYFIYLQFILNEKNCLQSKKTLPVFLKFLFECI